MGMNKKQIVAALKSLGNNQGYYGRLYSLFKRNDKMANRFINTIVVQHPKDVVDLVRIIES